MPSEPVAPTLLYVEDQIAIQAALVMALEDAGFRVLVADNGVQASSLLEAHYQGLHGLITDVNLGAGPDGWDVARKARELVAGLPVIYISAAAGHEWTARGVPGSVMIVKPFALPQVVVAISSLLVVSE